MTHLAQNMFSIISVISLEEYASYVGTPVYMLIAFFTAIFSPYLKARCS